MSEILPSPKIFSTSQDLSLCISGPPPLPKIQTLSLCLSLPLPNTQSPPSPLVHYRVFTVNHKMDPVTRTFTLDIKVVFPDGGWWGWILDTEVTRRAEA